MGPGIYVEFKTGMIIKWLNRLDLNTDDREMIIRARDYLIEEFPQVSKGDDMWSAIAYINAFGELPPLEQSEHIQEIMGWAMGILMPDGPPDPHTDELEWTFVQGMIHDDSPVLDSMKEKVAHAIVANQLQSGGWQHQFGTYNAVWAAILIVKCSAHWKVWLLVQAGRSLKNLHHPLTILLERIPTRISQPEHGMRFLIDKFFHNFNIAGRFQFAHVRR